MTIDLDVPPVETEDWKIAAERICTDMVKRAEKPIRQVADELYETMLISVQDYIRENVDYNLSGELTRLQHALDTTNDAFSIVERAIGSHAGMYPSKNRVAETAAELIRERDAAARERDGLREAMPDLTAVIGWLQNGCDPVHAITELAIYQGRIDRARQALQAGEKG